MSKKELSEKTKQQKCRFAFPDFKMEGEDVVTFYHCTKKQDNENTIVSEECCNCCKDYKSKYIEYPITVCSIETEQIEYNSIFHQNYIGKLVKIRPCAEEYENKTFLGIFIGDAPISTSVSYNEENQKLFVQHMDNPAIFVPELKKIIFGCESWWQIIENETQLSDITDEHIENTWYVQMLKAMVEKKTD